jgi:hypothetical protein
MKIKCSFRLMLIICLASAGMFAHVVRAQDIQTRGSIGGTVTDANGAALPGATVTVTGPERERTDRQQRRVPGGQPCAR